MTSRLERFCSVWRISTSGETPSVEREQNRTTSTNCSIGDDFTQHRNSNRFARLTYLAIQIALFLLQSSPASLAHQRVYQARIFGPPAAAQLNKTETIGDFDGDSLLDRAEFHQAGTHRCIRIRFGNERETHLLLSSTFFGRGTLLSRDVNNDQKPDLIWIFHYKLLPAMIWFGDGRGHFARATNDDDMHSLIFGYPGAKVEDAGSKYRLPSLTDSPIYWDLLCAVNVKTEIPKLLVSSHDKLRQDFGLYLSYLRERGPPPLSCC